MHTGEKGQKIAASLLKGSGRGNRERRGLCVRNTFCSLRTSSCVLFHRRHFAQIGCAGIRRDRAEAIGSGDRLR